MCKVLQIPRSTYYYEAQIKPSEDELSSKIVEIFHSNRQAYGTRKIKVELKKLGLTVSRRRIGRIMKENGLVSTYTVAQFKPHKDTCNESSVTNELNREFKQDNELAVVVSDLTYVRVNQKWHYVCLLVDLFNREIIGYSSGPNKDAKLVYRAISSVKGNLNDVCLFHTDSLSMKGCPYDNAVAEATFKVFKTEFIRGCQFDSLEDLQRELADYVHWYNHIRIHGTLGYMSPVQYKLGHLKKAV